MVFGYFKAKEENNKNKEEPKQKNYERVEIDEKIVKNLENWEKVEKLSEEKEKRIEELEKIFFSEESEENSKLLANYKCFLDEVYGKDKVSVEDKLDKRFFYTSLNAYQWKDNDFVGKMIKGHIQWRVDYKGEEMYENPKLLIEKLQKIEALDNKFLYNYGYDKNLYPILWIKLKDYTKFVRKGEKPKVTEIVNQMCFALEDIEKHRLPGKFRLTLIVDAEGIGADVLTLAVKIGKEFTKHCYQFFDILNQAIVVNGNWLLSKLWKIVALFLDEYTRNKYIFLDDLKDLQKYVDESTIPESFGGKSKINYSLEKHIECILKEREKEN